MSDILSILSNIFGWIYFIAWSVSFYGQIYTNWKLKSVEGYKLDFQILNITGFAFYSYVYINGYFFQGTNPYNNYGLGTVRIQDLLFAVHAFAMTCVTGIQCLIYPKGKNKVSMICLILVILYWTAAVALYIFFNVTKTIEDTEDFNFVIYLGVCKLMITVIKYIPPAYWNFTRKSTVGWSIENIVLDFTGGLFSILQTLIDHYDGTSEVINPIKFVLGNISMLFDILFMIQHFILYREKRKSNQKNYLELTETTEGAY